MREYLLTLLFSAPKANAQVLFMFKLDQTNARKGLVRAFRCIKNTILVAKRKRANICFLSYSQRAKRKYTSSFYVQTQPNPHA